MVAEPDNEKGFIPTFGEGSEIGEWTAAFDELAAADRRPRPRIVAKEEGMEKDWQRRATAEDRRNKEDRPVER